ncbi:transketolase C-terminal domain-containing protein [Selenomonas sp. TAMA-11512]|uniref:transketolase family protein n=1 Tax=Selenomonas sp. TAMA-11512 TaxID=3095337 RepID=UPI00308D24CD|nr:transketolase C-terminal domain-containing protein [Selenomonas sp. TAMA-11512]
MAANKQVMADVLQEAAGKDKDIVVLCSDSRGSASLGEYAKARPENFLEVGIAEQNLVGISAGLASAGKRPFAVSPASFISTRSYEQAKVDVAYSGVNVKLVGISGGISYGALGMSHHSAQDIAAFTAIPGMRVYLPSDQHQTRRLFEALCKDDQPAYIRIGRNAVDDVYEEGEMHFEMDKAVTVTEGTDVAILACGELVIHAKRAAEELAKEGVSARVLDMYAVKPIDRDAVIKAAKETKAIVTVEEHSPFGGLGAIVAQIVGENHPTKLKNLALPDDAIITGTSKEAFHYYGLDADGIAKAVREILA